LRSVAGIEGVAVIREQVTTKVTHFWPTTLAPVELERHAASVLQPIWELMV
jgi:hypothetical protein